MTFEEWYESNQNIIPFDDKEIGAAWELLRYFWISGYSQAMEDSDPAVDLPGMTDYTYEQFSKDCDRYDR